MRSYDSPSLMFSFLRLTPTDITAKPQASIYELKRRLDWGEPALTILDVRPGQEFHEFHVTGAVHVAAEQLVAWAIASLERDRDIYLYAETDADTQAAANALRTAGFTRVAELRGGAPAWKAVGFPVESSAFALAS